MIGCGIKRGKLYYLDLESKDSNKLQNALMTYGFEGEKSLKFGYDIDHWNMLPLVILKNCFLVCLQSVTSLVFTMMFVN